MAAVGTGYAFLYDELEARDAGAFVHVADRFDDAQRYLTRFSGPDRPYAFAFVGGDAVLCAPALFDRQARREFPGDVVYAPDELDAETPAGRAVEVLDAYGAEGTVLVPQHLPHDAAVRLENAGFELASTDAVARERAVKSDAEVERIRRVQDAAQSGMARAETVLARAAVDGDQLRVEGERLTTAGVRREIDAVLAREGVEPAANTVVAAGSACADLHFRGDVPVRPGETVLIDISPRGPQGYYGDITRTFVVDSDGGWERRASLAVEDAREAAFSELHAGATASRVHEEAAAEIGAHGFPAGYERETGFTHGVGHGVGVSLHEAPSLTSDATLEAGHVVTVEPGVYDPEEGGVRLEDLVVVTEEGFENLTAYPLSSSPEERS